jgi:signal transduction histidine kinase
MGDVGRPAGPQPFAVPLWRAAAVFRIAALCYAGILIALNYRGYQHPVAGWAVLVGMAAWTALVIPWYARSRAPNWPLLTADLVITMACVLSSRAVAAPGALPTQVPVLPAAWMAGAVLAWAISAGRRSAAAAGLLVGACDLVVRGGPSQNTLNATVLLLLAGVGVGHVARLSLDAQQRLRRATELAAASRELAATTRERERLARRIHDSVLQVLALVERRGKELGGQAAELGRLAGEQEVALRELVGAREVPGGPDRTGAVDLRAELSGHATAEVTIAAPADPVLVPAHAAAELAAAVGAALDNVRRHAGPTARAWVLVEDEPGLVTVTVRDDGTGIAPGRLAEAEAAGRLGVSQSIRGRLAALGGTATVESAPGAGTEVELRVPRRPVGSAP